ncbi:hypothetical protein ACWGOK_41610 [Streptomyces eurythermus]
MNKPILNNTPRVKADALFTAITTVPLINGVITGLCAAQVFSPLGSGPAFTLAALASSATAVGSYVGLNNAYTPVHVRLLAQADQVAAAYRADSVIGWPAKPGETPNKTATPVPKSDKPAAKSRPTGKPKS